MFSSVQTAVSHFKRGKPVVVVDDEHRENEGDLILPACKASVKWVTFMARNGSGLICASISSKVAKRIEVELLSSNNRDPNSTPFGSLVDHVSNFTGASVRDRVATLKALASSKSTSKDFRVPGHLPTLIADSEGVLKRAGHTESAVELCKLANLPEVAAVTEIMNADGSMARLPSLFKFAKRNGLKVISIEQLIKQRKKDAVIVKKISSAKLPTEFGKFTIFAYFHLASKTEHVALTIGNLKKEPLVRVHSSCLTGDTLGSLRCDCGSQLALALNLIARNGNGVLLYLNQEGRGIGLSNKIKAYALQEQGMDTIKANAALGFKDDLRDYGVGAEILRDLGVVKMKLLTNNPRKIIGLQGHGLKVTKRLQLKITANKHNFKYLNTKRKKMGHL